MPGMGLLTHVVPWMSCSAALATMTVQNLHHGLTVLSQVVLLLLLNARCPANVSAEKDVVHMPSIQLQRQSTWCKSFQHSIQLTPHSMPSMHVMLLHTDFSYVCVMSNTASIRHRLPALQQMPAAIAGDSLDKEERHAVFDAQGWKRSMLQAHAGSGKVPGCAVLWWPLVLCSVGGWCILLTATVRQQII